MYFLFLKYLEENVVLAVTPNYDISDQDWYYTFFRPNVCVEREEIDESQHLNRTGEAFGADGDDEGGLFGSFQFSSCQQTDIKYTCTTK